jgi:hypothetical protein
LVRDDAKAFLGTSQGKLGHAQFFPHSPDNMLRILEDGYLPDSPNPNRLWFWFTSGVKDPSQGDGLDCQRLLRESKEELATTF